MTVIVSRAQWGANPLVTPATDIATPTPELWLHHSGGEEFGAAGVRALQADMISRGYVDLAYNFVVDHVSCTVYESRGGGKNSAATGGHNTVSHAICVMGDFNQDKPSDQLLDTLADLVVYGYRAGWWAYPRFTGGHRDASMNSTDCPGDWLEASLGEINARAANILEPHPPIPTPPSPKKGPEPMIIMAPDSQQTDIHTKPAYFWLDRDGGMLWGENGATLVEPMIVSTDHVTRVLKVAGTPIAWGLVNDDTIYVAVEEDRAHPRHYHFA